MSNSNDWMPSFRSLLFSVVLLTLSAGHAVARCEGTVMLGGLRDAYRATLLETGETRQRAAMSLLVFAGSQSPAALSRQVARSGVSVPADHLAAILDDAKALAEATLANNRNADTGFRHSLNIDWLSATYVNSGCQNSVATTSRGGPSAAAASQPKASNPVQEYLAKQPVGLVVSVAVAALLMVCFAVYRFFTSFYMRSKRVERMPRSPIRIPLEVTYTDPEGGMTQSQVEAVDISLGGMKLSWPEPPPPGTLASFVLLSTNRLAQVSWSNSFYAGVMFQTPLNKTELSALSKENQP